MKDPFKDYREHLADWELDALHAECRALAQRDPADADGLTVARVEIAEHYGCSLSTVYRLTAKARKAKK